MARKKMTYKIISTENYLLIVDDSQITEGDWHIKINKNKVGNYPLDSVNPNKGRYKKIIAHLPLNGASILDGVDLLPPLEDDIDLMYENIEDLFYKKYDDALHYYSFIEGYNKSKERHKWTDEDLVRAFNIGVNSQFESTELKLNKDESIDRHSKNLLKLIQSLQQPKIPVGFECEQSLCFPSHCFRDCDMMCKYPRPKTTTNSQGITQWVGKYIY
jgi:hypothetical protein